MNLGYLDFSTLERRGWAIGRELAFNRPSAPDIYRRARCITRGAGGLAFDGEGEIVEHVLEMRRFDEGAVLDRRPEAVDGALAEALGREIGRLHAAAPLASAQGGLSALAYTVHSNAEHLRALTPILGAEEVEALVAATLSALDGAAPMLEARGAAGFSRRCHGDLHLGNILFERGRPVLFDCIEFNDRLSEIDILYDLAFLLMDLTFRGRREAAARVLSAWLDEAARTFEAGLFEGLALLPLMLSARATVRCHVRAQAGDADAARAYLAAALDHLKPASPVLAAVGGLSGTGKTTLARLLAPRLGTAPGAVVLRSDEVRKRLWGAGPLERLPPEAYGPEAGERVYARMLDEAAAALGAGRAVVLDAVFLRPQERAGAEVLAARRGVRFAGGWLEGRPETLRARVAARTGDASDADASVLEEQLTRDSGAIGWIRLEAEGDLSPAARTLASAFED